MKKVSKYCQIFPGGHNCPQLRTTDLNSAWAVVSVSGSYFRNFQKLKTVAGKILHASTFSLVICLRCYVTVSPRRPRPTPGMDFDDLIDLFPVSVFWLMTAQSMCWCWKHAEKTVGTGSDSPEERFCVFLVDWAKHNIAVYMFHKVENVRDSGRNKKSSFLL